VLGPAFAGDDHNDALFPSDVAKWFGEQAGPLTAVTLTSTVCRGITFKA